jgi:hypothetical protein
MAANQPNRIDIEQKGSSAAVFGRNGIEDMDASKGQIEGLRSIGVLVQEPAQIGRRAAGCGDCQEHNEYHQQGLARS